MSPPPTFDLPHFPWAIPVLRLHRVGKVQHSSFFPKTGPTNSSSCRKTIGSTTSSPPLSVHISRLIICHHTTQLIDNITIKYSCFIIYHKLCEVANWFDESLFMPNLPTNKNNYYPFSNSWSLLLIINLKTIEFPIYLMDNQ